MFVLWGVVGLVKGTSLAEGEVELRIGWVAPYISAGVVVAGLSSSSITILESIC